MEKTKITKEERKEHKLWLKQQRALDKVTSKSTKRTLPKQINKSGIIA